MRKAILTFLLAFVCVISIYAVPSGVYVNKRGRSVYYINGTEICLLNKDGNVTLRGRIVSEKDNVFTVQYETGISETRNAWFTDENGNIRLNIYGYPETLIRTK